MKQIGVNPSNKPYYSEDFIKGFECGTKTQFDADKEVIDRIKQAREEMVNGMPSIRTEGQLTGEDVVFSTACECYAECIMILDKLIAEVEGKE